jgi:hypothetical protein
MTLNSIRTRALNVRKTVCHTTTRKDVWIRCLNVSTLLHEKFLVSASKCLDCGQQAVKQNKKVTSYNKHRFLENKFQFTKLCLLFHCRSVRKIAKSDY